MDTPLWIALQSFFFLLFLVLGVVLCSSGSLFHPFLFTRALSPSLQGRHKLLPVGLHAEPVFQLLQHSPPERGTPITLFMLANWLTAHLFFAINNHQSPITNHQSLPQPLAAAALHALESRGSIQKKSIFIRKCKRTPHTSLEHQELSNVLPLSISLFRSQMHSQFLHHAFDSHSSHRSRTCSSVTTSSRWRASWWVGSSRSGSSLLEST